MFQVVGILALCIICIVIGMGIGGFYMGHKYCVELVKSRKLADKHLNLVRVYDLWMSLKQENYKIYDCLKEKGVQSVAIYGLSFLGIRLYYELKDSDIQIQYALDNNPKTEIIGLNVKKPDKCEKESMVDAVIVTAIFDFEPIKKNLEGFGYSNILSLYEILYEIKQKKC